MSFNAWKSFKGVKKEKKQEEIAWESKGEEKWTKKVLRLSFAGSGGGRRRESQGNLRGGRATQLIPLPARPADLNPLEPTRERSQPAPLLLFTLLTHAPAEIADAVGEARGGEGEGGGALARFPGRGAW